MNIARRLSRRAAPGLLLALTLLQTSGSDWHAVRDLVRHGDEQTSEEAQAETYRKAYAVARASVVARPKVSAEYLWVANAAGRLALVAPNAERVQLSRVVKDNAEKAIALDPKNGQAHMTLGGWHFYMADLGWLQKNAAKALYGGLPPASFEKAVEHLGRALALGGAENIVEIYYLRGRAYEELDLEASAEADYRRCVVTPARNVREKGLQEDAKKRL